MKKSEDRSFSLRVQKRFREHDGLFRFAKMSSVYVMLLRFFTFPSNLAILFVTLLLVS